MKKYARISVVWTACLCLLLSGCAVQTVKQPLSESAFNEASASASYDHGTSDMPVEVNDSDFITPEGFTTTAPPSRTESTSPSADAGAVLSETSAASSTRITQTVSPSAPASAAARPTVSASGTTAPSSSVPVPVPQASTNEIRAVWISYLDFSSLTKDRSEKAFRNIAGSMIRNIRDGRMNTVFLQVRPASDAMYRSSLYPYSAYISGTEGKDPGYDALAIFCDCARQAGLSIHAWINPFRVGDASKFDQKAASNPAKQILSDNDPNNDARIVRVGSSLYFDPADPENQQLILAGVRELLQNYAIGGIHIDDYFYPSTDLFIDQKDFDAYIAQGGTEARADWRRTQINTLVSSMYTCVKSFGSQKIFSISPAMEIEKNRSTMYADVARWASYGGYCDWLIPQVYVGFSNQTHPFRETVREWLSLKRSASVRLLFGLAAYKCGTEDKYAGSGSREWIENTDILSRQIAFLRSFDGSSGFALFSYAYTFGEKMSNNSKLEMKNVINML